jgi:hypothetical protein
LDHEILPRTNDRSVVGQLLSWFRRRVTATLVDRSGAETKPQLASPQLTSTGRLNPREDETSGEFAERVAAIKADVLRRALEAISSERFGDPPESDVDPEPRPESTAQRDGELAEEDASY